MNEPTHLQYLFPLLRASLIRHEGQKLEAYRDSKGHWTVGVGRLLAKKGEGKDFTGFTISQVISDLYLQEDMETAIQDCYSIIPDFNSLPCGIKLVMAEMAFNLGRTRLLGFKETLKALNNRDWITMADEMLDSKWYRKDVGYRAKYLSIIVEGHAI